MFPEPRPELRHAASVVHGALDFAELEQLGVAPDAVLDFSVNANPYGASPRVREALASVPVERYPDREALALRRLLAAHLHVDAQRIIAGNGSVELLWGMALAYVRPGDPVLVLGPTFGEYAQATALMGAQVQTWSARPQEDFRIDAEAVAERILQLHPRLVFVCNPNNPTGTILPVRVMAAWAQQAPQTLFVIDEAYLPFASGMASALTVSAPNLLILRSMTKAHALAGVRLGYAVGHAHIIATLALVRPPWNVNALAQAAGQAALEDQRYVQHCLERLADAKRLLIAGLRAMGLPPRPSATHFFLIHVGSAAVWRRALLHHGILVRDCASFGLPEHIRIATRQPQENERLLEALARVKQQCVSF